MKVPQFITFAFDEGDEFYLLTKCVTGIAVCLYSAARPEDGAYLVIAAQGLGINTGGRVVLTVRQAEAALIFVRGVVASHAKHGEEPGTALSLNKVIECVKADLPSTDILAPDGAIVTAPH